MNNKITLYTENVIDYAHKLREYNGLCSNTHGHSGLIKIWIQGIDDFKDKCGILFDFTNVKKIKEELDHKYLNEDVEVFKTVNPTAENISLYILNFLVGNDCRLEYRVRFYETAVGKDTYAQRQTDNFDISYL